MARDERTMNRKRMAILLLKPAKESMDYKEYFGASIRKIRHENK